MGKVHKQSVSRIALLLIFSFVVYIANRFGCSNSCSDCKQTCVRGYATEDATGRSTLVRNDSVKVVKFLDQPSSTHAGRGDETKDGEGDELTRLKKRKFTDYSEGHRRIYLAAITLIGGADTVREAVVLEVGTGIGWGLQKLMNDVRLKVYVGVEPCASCSQYVTTEIITPWIRKQQQAISMLSPRKRAAAKLPGFSLFPKSFLDVGDDEMRSALLGTQGADFAFCIEVAEHVQPVDRMAFLKKLRRWTVNALFLSTPNKEHRPNDGALSSDQWKELLLDAGFKSVSVLEWQWTVLFICT